MIASSVPPWLRPLLRAAARDRRRIARTVLDRRLPWDELRPALAAATSADPAGAEAGLAALAAEAGRVGDGATAGRVGAFHAYAAHRAGRIQTALDAYVHAEDLLRRAGLLEEALSLGTTRIDALATAGRIDEALALAASLAPQVRAARARRLVPLLAANQANALRLRGDATEARRLYAAAARGFDALGGAHRAAVSRMNAGVAGVEAGDAVAGRADILAAAEALHALGRTDLEREARANVAWADVHAGKLGDGIRALDVLAEAHRGDGLGRREAVCRTDLSDALLRAGDAAAAEREALRAAAGFHAAGAYAERAEALLRASAAAASRSPADARSHVDSAYVAAATAGRAALALRAQLLGLDAASRGGERPSPRAAAALAHRATALGAPALAAEARLVEGALHRARGNVAAARRAFREAERASAGRPWTRVSAATGLAMLDAQQPRRRAGALARLRRLGTFRDAVGADLPGAWLRARFLSDQLDPWLALVDLRLSRGRPDDRREAAAVLDALAARRFLGARRGKTGGARAARIRSRLEGLYDRIARGEGPTRGDGTAAGTALLERRARAWERALASSWRAEERRSRPGRRGPAAVGRSALVERGRVVLDRAADVHLWVRGDRVSGLVRIAGDIHEAADLGPRVRWSGWGEALRARSRAFAFLPVAGTVADRAVEALLAEIADAVLPALGVGAWPEEVRVTADPLLADLPWELLPSRGRRLGEIHDVVRTPLGHGVGARRPPGRGIVVLGVGAPDLPGVDAEVAAVAQAAHADGVHRGVAATRAALAEALARARVVHVAGHGWDASEAPPLAGVRMSDGWFCAEDVPDVVRADLVVLAACRTGASAGPAALAWGGLVPRLLVRGARRVVWTQDDLDDRSAAGTMTLFHRARAEVPDGVALGRALAAAAGAAGHPCAVLPFRLSGVRS